MVLALHVVHVANRLETGFIPRYYLLHAATGDWDCQSEYKLPRYPESRKFIYIEISWFDGWIVMVAFHDDGEYTLGKPPWSWEDFCGMVLFTRYMSIYLPVDVYISRFV